MVLSPLRHTNTQHNNYTTFVYEKTNMGTATSSHAHWQKTIQKQNQMFHFSMTLPLPWTLPLPLPLTLPQVENIAPSVWGLNPLLPVRNTSLALSTCFGALSVSDCKIYPKLHVNVIRKANNTKMDVAPIDTWDNCCLVSHVSLGVWEIGWLHENHW